MTNTASRPGKIALLGYCIESFEAATKLGYDFIAVVPSGFEVYLEKDGIQSIAWQFDKINENSSQLAESLINEKVRFAVPLFEETVEWAGAINARIQENPRLFNRAWLLRDKAMMKRKAQMSGIRVGVFEEVDNADDVLNFFKRVNDASGRIEGDPLFPIHLKPTTAAGSVGHVFIKSEEDIDGVPEDVYPCMVESHLDGQEFSCEVFVHEGKIQFLNINEYIHLGYSQLLPPTPALEAYRPRIR
ncbi:carboxylate--amine ligase, partial [bacterium]|nr:carboxylate--amine ligase [bacterium]